MTGPSPAASPSMTGSGIVLLTLASGQFLMTLDSSVMNVSIVQVAEDIGTDVTGVQTAITLYTLVMATMMITGGKVGSMLGRRRAFVIGCIVYGLGSLTTALAPDLVVLVIGWSVLEGLGAALIMPAIVGLVAVNFAPDQRPRAYGLVASAGAIAVAAGPLIGGAVTTYWTWRLVFAGEVVIVFAILLLTRRIHDAPPAGRVHFDIPGVVLSASGLGFVVFGVLRAGTWGWVRPKPDAPSVLGLSGTVWLVLLGLVVLRLFLAWQGHLVDRGREPLVTPELLSNVRVLGGLVMFFFQFLIQAGLFFTVPLYLSVALGLSALDTGVRLLPLSVTLLLAAVGIPRFLPDASPRKVVTWGLLGLVAGIVSLVAALEVGSGPEIVTVPLLLAGLGVGALASQLGAVTVSSAPERLSGEVGGVQNTVTNLGASLGTALAGAILIGGLTSSFVAGIESNKAVPPAVVSVAQTQLTAGVPFVSDAQLEDALADADVPDDVANAVVDENTKARVVALRVSLTAIALAAGLAIFFTRLLPTRPVGNDQVPSTPPQRSA